VDFILFNWAKKEGNPKAPIVIYGKNGMAGYNEGPNKVEFINTTLSTYR
jgi:hypothetical protein